MSIVAALRSTWRREVSELLDGTHAWGAVSSSSLRYGASQQRLIVYPPGITTAQRRWLRAWRAWPMWAATAWLVMLPTFAQLTDPWQAVALSSLLCALTGAIAFVMSARICGEVRTVTACILLGGAEGPKHSHDHRTVKLLTTTLLAAEALHHRGQLNPVDFECVWWQVYNAMDPESTAMTVENF